MESFLTLCSTMHYGKAAERLNLSQPAVSKHIQALEAEYGVTLFTYSGRRLKITPQGMLLKQYAQTLRYNEEMLRVQLHRPAKKQLRIGATKSIGDYILLSEIRRFLSHPDNHLEFTVDNTAHLLAQLEGGKLDFVVLEGLFDKERYDYFLLRQEPYIGICSKGHPLDGREAEIQELFNYRLILREQGSGTRNILERALAQQGYGIQSFQDSVCISSFLPIKELVKDGYGISFLYEAVVKGDDAIGRFCCPSLTGFHELNVVYLKNTKAGEFAQEFLTGHRTR